MDTGGDGEYSSQKILKTEDKSMITFSIERVLVYFQNQNELQLRTNGEHTYLHAEDPVIAQEIKT